MAGLPATTQSTIQEIAMDGFSSHFTVKTRSLQLLALAVAGWMGLATPSSLIAQESEALLAPPSLPSDAPPVKYTKVLPSKRYTRKAPPRPGDQADHAEAVTQLIPTGPNDFIPKNPRRAAGRFGETTELIPTQAQRTAALVKKRKAPATSAWAEPTSVKPTPEIIQVQAETVENESLVPGDGLEVNAIESLDSFAASGEPSSGFAESFEVGQAPTLGESPVTTEEQFEPAPVMQAAPYEPAPLNEEPESEPAPLNDRVGNPQRVPAQFNIRRTAAADAAPYNDGSATEFNPHDAVHTVAAGESFWSISKKHYKLGRYSGALAEYNKSRIPRPDKIKPGMKVIVPPVQTLEQKFSHLISGASASAAEVAAPAKTGFFVDANGQPMYRIGKGDTLSDIAQNHLGRSSRWIQIVSLNKETLPNPDEMKLGMVLRLPPDASEASQTR